MWVWYHGNEFLSSFFSFFGYFSNFFGYFHGIFDILWDI